MQLVGVLDGAISSAGTVSGAVVVVHIVLVLVPVSGAAVCVGSDQRE